MQTALRPSARADSGAVALGAGTRDTSLVSSPRVSIALATCQGERFLEAQLESIACQSRLPDQLVISDDASEDRTFDLATAFAARADFDVELERNPERLGITQNFERSLSLCSGDVIFLADQDDVWEADKIETVIGVLEARPEVGAVFHNAEVVGEALDPLGTSLWDSLGFGEREQQRVRSGAALEVFLRHVVAAGTTMAFRSRYLQLALPFPRLRSCHDAFTAFVIAAVAEVAIVDRNLIRYRLHGANQIGIRKLGFREQLEKAREQIATDAFAYAAEFFEAARERLTASQFQVGRSTLQAIDEKIRHSRCRARMPERLSSRLPDIAREVVSGRYWRYSYGIRSVAQDVWLR